MFKKILCAVDGSDHARKALGVAIELARDHKAELVLLQALLHNADSAELARFAEVEGLVEHVAPEMARLRGLDGRVELGASTYDETRASSRVLVEIGQHLLDDAKHQALEGGVRNVEVALVGGDPAREILDCIDARGIDCVVLGSRGLSDVKGLFLGSVSHKVANNAPCTCIAVK